MEEETSACVWSHSITQPQKLSGNQGKNFPDSKFFILNKWLLEEIWNYMKEMILSPQLTVNNSLIPIHTIIAVT